MSQVVTKVSESEAITAVLEQYLAGARSGSGDQMRPAFYRDATIFGYLGNDLLEGSIEQLYRWNDENGAAAELQARISTIDVVGTVATARVELDNWTGYRFTDLFTLLKIDGVWKIMNKVFHLHPSGEGPPEKQL